MCRSGGESTGLTFGTISALYGLTHGIFSQEQYSHLVAVVIGSAVVPTLFAQAFFLPHHLLPAPGEAGTRKQAALMSQAGTQGAPEHD